MLQATPNTAPASLQAAHVLTVLQEAQAAQARFNELQKQLGDALLAVVNSRLPAGTVIELAQPVFGRVTVTAGNGRHAQAFEVAGAAQLVSLQVRAPNLSRFAVEAYPLNAQGKRLSGRAGNSSMGRGDTVTLAFHLADGRGPEDLRPANDILLDALPGRGE